MAPIIQPGGCVEVYFPAGQAWYDLATNERIEGGEIRTISKSIEQLPAWGREGHLLCLGRAVQHTGEINLASPIEEVRVFGVPTVAPCVMQSCVTVTWEQGDACITGIKALQCRLPAGLQALDIAGGVRIEWQANG